MPVGVDDLTTPPVFVDDTSNIYPVEDQYPITDSAISQTPNIEEDYDVGYDVGEVDPRLASAAEEAGYTPDPVVVDTSYGEGGVDPGLAAAVEAQEPTVSYPDTPPPSVQTPVIEEDYEALPIDPGLAAAVESQQEPNTPNTCLLYTSPSPRDS